MTSSDSRKQERSSPKSSMYFSLTQKEILQGVPVLILANKQDLPDASSEKDISEILGLARIKERDWAIFKCSAFTGAGLNEALDWVVDKLTPLL